MSDPVNERSSPPRALGVARVGQYRRNRPITNVTHWARARGLDVVEIPIEPGSSPPDCSGVGCIFVPLLFDVSFLAGVPAHIPVVLDYDGARECKGGELLTARRFALRRAFGGRIPYRPAMEVPYLHLPLEYRNEGGIRDVIIVDVHRWLPWSSHFGFMSLLTALGVHYAQLEKEAGHPVKFYFTSFTTPRPYHGAAEAFLEINGVAPPYIPNKENPIQPIVDRLIPPCQDVAQYHQLFPRARLFLTDHGDLADQDVVHAGAAGVPIMTVPRNPFTASKGITFSFAAAGETLAPGFNDLLQTAEARRLTPELGMLRIFRTASVPAWDNDVLTAAFMRSWDRLWDWALHDRQDLALLTAMKAGVPWAP